MVDRNNLDIDVQDLVAGAPSVTARMGEGHLNIYNHGTDRHYEVPVGETHFSGCARRTRIKGCNSRFDEKVYRGINKEVINKIREKIESDGDVVSASEIYNVAITERDWVERLYREMSGLPRRMTEGEILDTYSSLVRYTEKVANKKMGVDVKVNSAFGKFFRVGLRG